MYSATRHFCGEGPRSAIRHASLNARSRPNEPRVWFSALPGSKIIILHHQRNMNLDITTFLSAERPSNPGYSNRDDSRLKVDALRMTR